MVLEVCAVCCSLYLRLWRVGFVCTEVSKVREVIRFVLCMLETIEGELYLLEVLNVFAVRCFVCWRMEGDLSFGISKFSLWQSRCCTRQAAGGKSIEMSSTLDFTHTNH
jgi:hypothetical protein